MRPTDHLPPRRVTGDSGTAATSTAVTSTAAKGPALSTVRSVIDRLAYLVRCAGIVYTVAQIAIWHSFYMASPWRLTLPAAAIAWAMAAVFYLRRRRPALVFACLDCAAYVALALSAQDAVPLSLRGHAFSWVVISMSSQLIVPAWYAPAALSVPLAFASPAAYWIGARQIERTDIRVAVVTALLLIMVAGVHLYGRRQLDGRAAAADAALDRADRLASEQYVILSRNIEDREHDRLLHDTILNTLTALARTGGDDVAAMVDRCRQDVTLIEARLSDPGAGSGRDGTDLVAGVQAVAAAMRARGLDVHVEVAGDGAPVFPAAVTTGLSGAVREALANVITHARTAEAWIEVSVTAADAGARAPGRLRVTVRDRGIGFDPATVDPARLGLRRSIAERTADCGGQAAIWSAPGQGTVVRLSWPAPVSAAVAGPPLVQESPAR
jgi:signal transduction histidine kinase